MRYSIFLKTALAILLFCSNAIYAIDPPKIIATSNPKPYCPGTYTKIIETVSITFDSLEPNTDAVYIQISSGYSTGDLLTLDTSLHPTISIGFGFNTNTGTLKLLSTTGNKIPYANFEAAIKDILFHNSLASPSGIRKFSISLGTGQLSYLPSNKHFYKYVSSPGISWTTAKTLAESPTNYYYGLHGYLATLTTADEARLAGEQAPGNGWIGGSDAETEGIWKWVTGPEMGTVMTYTNWNNGEPNNSNGNENYAHIKAPGVPGIPGSWNDLQVNGDPIGDYQSKGYIIEYGGMVTNDVESIQISASTSMTIPKITGVTPASRCDLGTVNLTATASNGTINWYADQIGGTSLKTGTNYETDSITVTTPYYVDAFSGSCASGTRTEIIATVNKIPTIKSTNSGISRCGPGSIILNATSTIGTANWYASETSTTILLTNLSYATNVTENTIFYVEATNKGCVDGTRTRVDAAVVYELPIVSDEHLILCETDTITLVASISGMTYLWYPNNEITETIQASTPGTFSVKITNPENCSTTKTILLYEHKIPLIETIEVNETTVEIKLKNPEIYYEYSIDGLNYQSSNLFLNSQSGLQTAYIRDTNNCRNATQKFIVLFIPLFFTPNYDSFNDVWEVKGLVNYPNAELLIFDRFGKLIKKLDASNLSWDGTFNGANLPSDDYWYVLKVKEINLEKRGHFTLKR